GRGGLARDLCRRRDRQTPLLRRLVFAARADVVAIGRQLRTGDACDGAVACAPAGSFRGPRRAACRGGGYFTARQIKNALCQAGFIPAVPWRPSVARERRGSRGGAISKDHPYRAPRATSVLTRAISPRGR